MVTLLLYWQKLNYYFNQLSLRERLLAALVVVVLTYSAWDWLWMQHITQQRRILVQTSQQLSQEVQALEDSYSALRVQPQPDAAAIYKRQITQLEQDIAHLDHALQQRLQTLVSPSEMASLLQAWLQQQNSLKLIKLENLPPKAIFNANLSDGQTGQLYKHGLRVAFRGRYLDTMAYLETLENLPWAMYWERVNITVQQYPETRVELTVYTLSFSSTWIRG